MATPGDRASPLNEKVLTGVRDLIERAVQKGNGVLDARDLYQIRKEGVNDVVQTLTKDLDASTKNRAGTLVGGSGWKDYLKTYGDMSRGIDQMRVGKLLAEKLTAPITEQGDGVTQITQRGAAYAQALRDAPGTLKKSTGNPRYENIRQILTPEQTAAMQDPKAMATLMESATPAERAALAPYLPTAPILTGAKALYQGQ